MCGLGVGGEAVLDGRDLAGDLARHIGHVDGFDRRDAGAPVDEVVPVGLRSDTQWRNEPEAGHYNPSHAPLLC